MMPPKAKPIKDRLLSKIIVKQSSGCWVYTGAKHNQGYGLISIGNNMKLAHRVSYEAFVSKIPNGLTIDHLCKNRRCINPEHLEPVTMIENLRRGNGVGVINSRKTACPKGHPFVTITTKNGRKRFCSECNRIRARINQAKQTETNKMEMI